MGAVVGLNSVDRTPVGETIFDLLFKSHLSQPRWPKGSSKGGEWSPTHGVAPPKLSGPAEKVSRWRQKISNIDEAHHRVTQRGEDKESTFAAVEPSKTTHPAVQKYFNDVKATAGAKPSAPEPPRANRLAETQKVRVDNSHGVRDMITADKDANPTAVYKLSSAIREVAAVHSGDFKLITETGIVRSVNFTDTPTVSFGVGEGQQSNGAFSPGHQKISLLKDMLSDEAIRTYFHEQGHAVDYAIGKRTGVGTYASVDHPEILANFKKELRTYARTQSEASYDLAYYAQDGKEVVAEMYGAFRGGEGLRGRYSTGTVRRVFPKTIESINKLLRGAGLKDL